MVIPRVKGKAERSAECWPNGHKNCWDGIALGRRFWWSARLKTWGWTTRGINYVLETNPFFLFSFGLLPALCHAQTPEIVLQAPLPKEMSQFVKEDR